MGLNVAAAADAGSVLGSLRCLGVYSEDEDRTGGFISTMQYVLIIHEVADYTSWKKVFDNAAAIRREAGERSFQVLKYAADPNKVVHFSAWTSIADAKAFFESPRLVEIRREAGVKSPEFIYLDQLESGSL